MALESIQRPLPADFAKIPQRRSQGRGAGLDPQHAQAGAVAPSHPDGAVSRGKVGPARRIPADRVLRSNSAPSSPTPCADVRQFGAAAAPWTPASGSPAARCAVTCRSGITATVYVGYTRPAIAARSSATASWSTARAIRARLNRQLLVRLPTPMAMARRSAAAWPWAGRCRSAGAGMIPGMTRGGVRGAIPAVQATGAAPWRSVTAGRRRGGRLRGNLGNPWTGNYGRAGQGSYYNTATGGLAPRLRRAQHQHLHRDLDRRGRRRALHPQTGRVVAGQGGSVSNIHRQKAWPAARAP